MEESPSILPSCRWALSPKPRLHSVAPSLTVPQTTAVSVLPFGAAQDACIVNIPSSFQMCQAKHGFEGWNSHWGTSNRFFAVLSSTMRHGSCLPLSSPPLDASVSPLATAPPACLSARHSVAYPSLCIWVFPILPHAKFFSIRRELQLQPRTP